MIRFRVTAVVVVGLSGLLAACAGGGIPTPAPTPSPATVPGMAQGSPVMAAGLIGSVVGVGLPATDLQAGLLAEYRALELGAPGTPVPWVGSSGVRGEVVPGARYRVNAYECRDYTHTVYRGAAPESARGTACRETDGSWNPVV